MSVASSPAVLVDSSISSETLRYFVAVAGAAAHIKTGMWLAAARSHRMVQLAAEAEMQLAAAAEVAPLAELVLAEHPAQSDDFRTRRRTDPCSRYYCCHSACRMQRMASSPSPLFETHLVAHLSHLAHYRHRVPVLLQTY